MLDFLDKLDINQYLPGVIAWATNIILAILILLFGFWLAGRVKKMIVALSAKHEDLDDTLFRFLGDIIRYAILAFVLIAVLNRFGVETASIIAMLGAAGLAIGFAVQGALSNLAAGVMLMIFRPYDEDDFVDVAGQFGIVDEIQMFTTSLRTYDNQYIVIPNSKIWGEKIINHSHYELRGVYLYFNIAFSADTDVAREVIQEVLAKHPKVVAEPEPFIEVEKLKESSVEFLAIPFCKSEDYFGVMYTVPELVKKGFQARGVEIAVPHRKVVVVNEEQNAAQATSQ